MKTNPMLLLLLLVSSTFHLCLTWAYLSHLPVCAQVSWQVRWPAAANALKDPNCQLLAREHLSCGSQTNKASKSFFFFFFFLSLLNTTCLIAANKLIWLKAKHSLASHFNLCCCCWCCFCSWWWWWCWCRFNLSLPGQVSAQMHLLFNKLARASFPTHSLAC